MTNPDLVESPLATAALTAALEAISGLAFVARTGPLEILLANSKGSAAYERNRPETLARLVAAISDSAGSGAVVAPLGRNEPPCRGHVLVVVQTGNHPLGANLVRATRLWQLSPRQSQVLELLVQGSPNKDIAETLRCTVKTVEKHVSAVLEKARVRSRAALPLSVGRL